MVGVGLEHAGVGVTGSAVRRIDHEGLLGPVWRERLVAEAEGSKPEAIFRVLAGAAAAEPSAPLAAAPEASPLPMPLPSPVAEPPEQSQLSCSQAAKARIAESANSRGREERMVHLCRERGIGSIVSHRTKV